jgi:hypothetical protein
MQYGFILQIYNTAPGQDLPEIKLVQIFIHSEEKKD